MSIVVLRFIENLNLREPRMSHHESNDERSDAQPDLDRVLEVAVQAAQAGAEVLMQHLGNVVVMQKSSQNLVTQADLESEEVIRQLIYQAFPEHQFLGEEGISPVSTDADELWIVDPLDGTNNYAHGIPQFCVSIAFARRGSVQVGVVLDPHRHELFTAVRGAGACLNGIPIRVSTRAALNESIIATGFYYDRGEMMERTLAAIRSLFGRNIRGIRRFGAAAIDQCWVACGRFEGFFEYQLAAWDYAAGSLIVAEAGGRAADRQGAALQLVSRSLIVANALVFDELCATVRW